MINNRMSIGLDVHARSVVGCALDGETGEIHRRRMSPDLDEILGWVRSMPTPVRVVYEAGPTGFGLARFLLASDIDCLVAAPSKLQRPAGDRVKTDARDALHLARLLKLGEIVEVTVPSITQESARDLVRARDDVRGGPAGTRHPLLPGVRGHEGNLRLNRRWQAFNDRQKKPVIANVAIARELAGWCWSLAALE